MVYTNNTYTNNIYTHKVFYLFFLTKWCLFLGGHALEVCLWTVSVNLTVRVWPPLLRRDANALGFLQTT